MIQAKKGQDLYMCTVLNKCFMICLALTGGVSHGQTKQDL